MNGGSAIEVIGKKCDEYAAVKQNECARATNIKCNISDVLNKSNTNTMDSSETAIDRNIDAQSTKSDVSTDIDVEIQDKDDQKLVSSGDTAQMMDANNWVNASKKSAKEATAAHDCGRDSNIPNNQSYSLNGVNMMGNNLKKEVSTRSSNILDNDI